MAINKMFILLPVMFAARKLDGEDPTTVYWLRVAYFSVQTIVLALVGYTYIQATAAAKALDGRVIYVPPPPQVRQIGGEWKQNDNLVDCIALYLMRDCCVIAQ